MAFINMKNIICLGMMVASLSACNNSSTAITSKNNNNHQMSFQDLIRNISGNEMARMKNMLLRENSNYF